MLYQLHYFDAHQVAFFSCIALSLPPFFECLLFIIAHHFCSTSEMTCPLLHCCTLQRMHAIYTCQFFHNFRVRFIYSYQKFNHRTLFHVFTSVAHRIIAKRNEKKADASCNKIIYRILLIIKHIVMSNLLFKSLFWLKTNLFLQIKKNERRKRNEPF